MKLEIFENLKFMDREAYAMSRRFDDLDKNEMRKHSLVFCAPMICVTEQRKFFIVYEQSGFDHHFSRRHMSAGEVFYPASISFETAASCWVVKFLGFGNWRNSWDVEIELASTDGDNEK